MKAVGVREGVHRLRSHLREPLFRNAYALMLSQAGMGAMGVLYWALAARRYPAAVVGQNAGLIAAMMTLSTFAQLDMAAMLLKFLPIWRREAARVIGLSYLISTVVSVLASVGFVLVVPHFSRSLAFLHHAGIATAFCVAVVAWGVFAIEDGVLTGLSRATVVPFENTAYSFGKLVLLLGIASIMPRWGIFVSWNVPMLIVIVPINLLIFRRYLPIHARRTVGDQPRLDRRTLTRYIGIDYVGGLCGIAMSIAMPLLVLNVLGPVGNGYFYIAWTFIMMLDAVSLSMSTSLLVEGSYNPTSLSEYGRRAFRRTFSLIAPATVGVLVLGPVILSFFGHRYESHSTTALRILALGLLPRVVVSTYASMARVQGHVNRMLRVVLVETVLSVGGAVILGRDYGLNGVAIGWTLGNVVVGAAVLVPVLAMTGLLGRRDRPDPQAASAVDAYVVD
jgi:O-antigen/teichoic acid export membrane protein